MPWPNSGSGTPQVGVDHTAPTVIVAPSVGWTSYEGGGWAVDATTGEPLWQRDGTEPVASGRIHEGTLLAVDWQAPSEVRSVTHIDPMTGEPAWNSDGTSEVHFSQTHGLVFLADQTRMQAIEADTGEVRWTIEPDDDGFVGRMLGDGQLFGQRIPTAVAAIDPLTGAEQWRWQPGAVHNQQYVHDVAADDDLAVVTWSDHTLHDPLASNPFAVLDARTGAQLAGGDLQDIPDTRLDTDPNGTAGLYDGVLYLSARTWPPPPNPDQSTRLVARDARSLDDRWTLDTGGRPIVRPLTGSDVLVGWNTGSSPFDASPGLARVAADGRILWRWDGPLNERLIEPLLDGDLIIAATASHDSGSITAIDAGTGQQIGSHAAGPVLVQPIAVDDGIIITEAPGWLFCD